MKTEKTDRPLLMPKIEDIGLPVFVSAGVCFKKKEKRTVPKPDPNMMNLLDQMSDSDLAYLCIGRFKEKGSASVIENAGTAVAGSAGKTSRRCTD